MHEAFIDLDELISRCRDKSSKNLIQEAVTCYRAGAFRSCIIATWNAIVFDFLHKMKDLELLGDKKASDLLQEFEKLRSEEKKYRDLWHFESRIPQIACSEFELISSVEKTDIERLFQDRSRCAHPSMTSLDEPFEATAELARCHLRSAVTHILQRQPVQGKAAKEKVFNEIKSAFFPVDIENAIRVLNAGPIASAREGLIKDVVLGLTISLLKEELPQEERERQFSALIAISKIHYEKTREILNSNLSKIISNKVDDENWDKTIIYLGKISLWDTLSEACQIKARNFINSLSVYETNKSWNKIFAPRTISILENASRIEFLRDAIIEKFRIPLKDILSSKGVFKDAFFEEKIISPILKELSFEATLDDLILIISSNFIKADKTIEELLKKQILAANLQKLLESSSICRATDKLDDEIINILNEAIRKEIEKERDLISLKDIALLVERFGDDVFFVDLAKAEIKCKIPNSDLATLVLSKMCIPEDQLEILQLLNDHINSQIKTVPFSDILFFVRNNLCEMISDENLKPILQDNIPALIKNYKESSSWDSAGSNSKIFLKIAEYLSPENWVEILEAFFDNDQIRNSNYCPKHFQALFRKSMELSNVIEPYWITFRAKLDEYNNWQHREIKKLIDLYQ